MVTYRAAKNVFCVVVSKKWICTSCGVARQIFENRIMSSANYWKTYYVTCKMLRNVLCYVQTIEKRIMSSVTYWKSYYVKCKVVKNVLCHVQTIEKRIMSSANYGKTYYVKCKKLKNVLCQVQNVWKTFGINVHHPKWKSNISFKQLSTKLLLFFDNVCVKFVVFRTYFDDNFSELQDM